LTLDPSLNQVPVWSPDGKKIAFTSNRTLFNRVFEKNADGSGQEIEVVDLDVRRQVNAWDWLRDGKYVLLRNENEVWYYSPSENKSRTYIQEKWPVRNAQFSPDGKYVAYTTNESGRWEVCVSPFPNATSRWKVSHNGGEERRCSPDGTELYFLTPEGSRQMPTKKQIPHSAAETKTSPA
jgi:Tol biopolymer transport system component